MLKTLRWVYQLGASHERRRIRLAMARLQGEKPEMTRFSNHTKEEQENDYHRAVAVWYEVQNVLNRLTEPQWAAGQNVPPSILDNEAEE